VRPTSSRADGSGRTSYAVWSSPALGRFRRFWRSAPAAHERPVASHGEEQAFGLESSHRLPDGPGRDGVLGAEHRDARHPAIGSQPARSDLGAQQRGFTITPIGQLCAHQPSRVGWQLAAQIEPSCALGLNCGRSRVVTAVRRLLTPPAARDRRIFAAVKVDGELWASRQIFRLCALEAAWRFAEAPHLPRIRTADGVGVSSSPGASAP